MSWLGKTACVNRSQACFKVNQGQEQTWVPSEENIHKTQQ